MIRQLPFSCPEGDKNEKIQCVETVGNGASDRDRSCDLAAFEDRGNVPDGASDQHHCCSFIGPS